MTDLSEFDASEELESLRRANIHLMRQLAEAKRRTDAMIQATYDGARDAVVSMGRAQVPKVKADRRRNDAEVALLHLTDWQGRKLTPSYNGQVMRERVLRYCERVDRIVQVQRAHHPVRQAVILFTGDMGEGLFNFPTQVFEIDASLFEQFVSVARLEADVVLWALAHFESVQVVCEWGNHGRIGSKRSAVPRSDNFDRMTYELARNLVGPHHSLTWQEGEDDIQRLEVGNYRALVIHGDEIGRNGYAAPTTIVQHANRWRSGAYPWEFRDVYMGHYHTHACWPLANGEGSVFQTGSTESDNRYAGVTMASTAIPSQRLHFVDPDKGRVTAEYKVWLA